ncbi:hypothetical protein R6L23_33705, partial [Streptomyces sp. SR27]|nr:hypothetical protein [Streptomyces sp. SR27]
RSLGPSASAGAARPSPGPSRTETATEPQAPGDVGAADEAVREEDAALPDTPPASRRAAAPRIASEAASPLADQRVPVLTLGVGLALMGLGIGFLGLRMRRR